MASRTRRTAAATTFVLPGAPSDAVDQFDAAARDLFAGELALSVALLSRFADDPIATGPAYDALRWLVDDIETGAGNRDWARRFTGLINDVVKAGGTDLGTMVGTGFSALDRGVYKAITERADTLAQYVGQTTAGNIVQAFHAVKAANGTATDLAHAISRDVLGEDAVSARARMIANTEVLIAYGQGADYAARDSGVIESKMWIASGSANPRDWHAEIDGEIVPLDEPFSIGLMYAGDPDADIEDLANCGCGTAYIEQSQTEGDTGDGEFLG